MLLLNRFGLILAKTYGEKFKSKAFLITTIIFALSIIVGTNFQTIMDSFGSDDGESGSGEGWTVAVYDEEGSVAAALEQQIHIVNQNITIENSDKELEELERQVEAGEYDALLTVSLQDSGKISANYLSESLSTNGNSADLQLSLQTIQSNLAAAKLNLSADELATLNMPVAFEQSSFLETAKSEEELNEARGLVYIMIFVIYMSVLIYSLMIATEVATEKSSRVMEILVSSVPPIQQIFAKIVGIGLLGLTQLAFWAITGFISIRFSRDSLEGGIYSLFDFSANSIETISFGIIFFLLGYFLFATLAAFLGSLVSRTEDIQQMMMPVNLLIIAGAMLAFYGLADPEANFITITSYIPFFSPLVMFTRVGMLNIPLWEPMVAIALTLAAIFIIGWFGAKVYRGGVLMYGNSSSFKDMKKALILSKKEK
ncbi:ABC transporter permease [Jeotgalibacillus sp. S-D1]|uniref:ABC transporter permease n=1 Tax=Jeotgalibacillus sp. S-D1 TaxID=2552189 RepID=UPI0027B90977|nr:ABC transporter permease [Jeotgalibacillus sp. S-D1]